MSKFLLKPVVALAILTLCFAGGCVTPEGGKTRETTTEKVIPSDGSAWEAAVVQETIIEEVPPSEPISRFSDVPVPAKFKLDRSKSFIYEAGQMKAGFLIYEGISNLEDIISFYRAEMLPFQWKLMSTFETSDATLHYEKPGWFCRIQIKPSTFRKSTILISIGPKPAE